MRRVLFVCALAAATVPLSARAGEPADPYGYDVQPAPREVGVVKKAWIGFWRDYKRNYRWPDPFVTADRLSVRVPFETMTLNGWRLQNTLSEHHFDGDSTRLTEAGRLKVSAIINETPVAYRAIFVLRTNDPAISAGRVAAVQEQAALVLGDRQPVPVFETYEKARGAPAMYIDEVTRRYQATTPDPRLPNDDSASDEAGTMN
ncbi:MAG: hypothetical protein HYX69_02545 [Planctomycetia bacterium]|nr:hypothetical protein [Planctomycetia bacterium]